MKKLYRVKLTAAERSQLQDLLSKGKAAARTLMHARILLKADENVDGPRLIDDEIAEAVEEEFIPRPLPGCCTVRSVSTRMEDVAR